MRENYYDIQSGATRRNRKKAYIPGRIYFLITVLIVAILVMGVNILGLAVSLHGNSNEPEQKAFTTPDDGTESKEEGKEEPNKEYDWRMALVNPWNPISDNIDMELAEIESGHKMDKRASEDAKAMLSDCRAQGFSPIICSSYRTMENQQTLFSNSMQNRINEGYDEDTAYTETAKWVAVPGTSEHQLGLALDIVDESNQRLDESQETTDVQLWLMENSYKYGFILRYPSSKTEKTGIQYEPWHYRYVGIENAKKIYDSGLCLEEYLELN